MGFAYSINANGNLSYRAVAAAAACVAGESYFATVPTDAELGAGFATYAALQAAQNAQTAYTDLLAGGLTVTSTGTPALNGVYAIDPTSQANIATEAQFVSTFSEFTNGGTTNLVYPLANGTTVTFPTTTEWMAFAKAVAQFVAAAKLALVQHSAMPSANITIA